MISSRHSLLSTYLFYQGLAYLGENAAPGPGSSAAIAGRPGQGSKTLGDLLGKIEVQVPGPDGAWHVGGIHRGDRPPGRQRPHAAPAGTGSRRPPSAPEIDQGNWRLDYVALAVLGNEVTPARLVPRAGPAATGLPGPEALDELTSTGPHPHHAARRQFRSGVRTADRRARNDVFLESRGYYLEWMRNEWMAEEDPVKAAMMFRYPELALGYLAPQFKELEPDMEAHFWGSRYARL